MYLIIDASASKTLVACGDRAKIAAIREWVAGVKLSKELLPAIEKILARRIRPSAIFCVTGPGSYTGLRIAVSTANALGYAWRIPVVPVEAFEIYEAAQKKLKPPYTVVLDNIKDLVYVKRVSGRQSKFAVEKIGEGKRQKVKGKRATTIGFVPRAKTVGLGPEISGKARGRLILKIGENCLTHRQANIFSHPIKPLYINPPHVTIKKVIRNFCLLPFAL